MRSFRCRECGEEKTVDARTGPLPSVCDDCDPERAAARERNRAQSKGAAQRRAGEIQALRDRVAELEAALSFDGDAAARLGKLKARGVDDSPRAVLGRAVRALACVRGRRETYDALLDVSAAARSWARSIAEGDGERAAA